MDPFVVRVGAAEVPKALRCVIGKESYLGFKPEARGKGLGLRFP